MATTRERNPRGEGGRLRGEILRAVNELLDEWGSGERLTMRAVAAAAGVSAPSIYLQFADKTELVWAALSDKYVQLADEMQAADNAVASPDPIEHLRAQMHAYCAFGFENPGKYRLMYESRQPRVDSARIAGHPASLVSSSLRRASARCANAGCTFSLPSDEVAHLLWMGMHGALSLTHSLFDQFDTNLVMQLTDGLLDSLIAPPGSAFRDAAGRVESPVSREIRVLLGEEEPSDS